MKEKTILHSDVNNFFASVETALHPEYSDKPLAVTGNPKKRTGIILAKNELAKKFGVRTGEAIWEAQKKCPDLITVAPHYDIYEKISKQLHQLYLQYTDLVEPMGLDECWLDVTPSLKLLNKNGEQIANEIRQKVKEQFNITVSVGVSFSKIFAKLGSDMKKPDATTVISPANYKKLVYPMSLNSIVGIGWKLSKKFEKMNISTIQDFISLKEDFIGQIMGKPGIELQQKLKGEYDEKVCCYYEIAPPKSIGNGTTTILDITSRNDISKVVTFLSEKISLRMAEAKVESCCISVSLKTNQLKTYHHSRTLAPIRSCEEISTQALSLIDSFWKFDQPIRAIRINMSSLDRIDKCEQLSFFNNETNQLNKTIKDIKAKYGNDKIFIASDTVSFINRKDSSEEHPQ